MSEPSFSSPLRKVIQEPEMRLVFYLAPFFVILVVIGFVFLPLLWAFIVFGIALIWLLMNGIVGWKLAQATIDMRNQSSQMRTVISDIETGVLAYDDHFSVRIFNKAASEIFNITENEIIGQVLSTDMVSNPRYSVLAQTIFTSLAPTVIQRSDEGAYPSIADLVFENPHLELRVVTNRVIDERGAVVGFVKMITNKTREKELLQAKSEFISVAAHQLRTPLTAVHWAFEALESESLTSSQKDLVTTGFVASKLMLKTVNDLLDVAKIEEGKFGYQFVDVDAVTFIESLLNEAQTVAAQYNMKVYFQRPTKPIRPIFIDQQKLGMALFNLIDNAIKYNVENGEVTVAVHEEIDKPFIVISIKDTGIGIPQDQLGKLFGKFFRADNATKFSPNGTGLGLYITKNIIVRHGGSITVESEINRGTTFFVYLPTDKSLIPKREVTELD